MCFFLHRGHTCGCLVSGFLAVGAGESGSDTLTPSLFANMDAALNILMPSAHWLKAMHGCIPYQAMCPHSVFELKCGHRSDDLADWQLLRVLLLGFFWGFFMCKPDSGRRGWSVLVYCPCGKLRCTPRPGSWEALLLLWSRCIFLVCLSWKPHFTWLRKTLFCIPYRKRCAKEMSASWRTTMSAASGWWPAPEEWICWCHLSALSSHPPIHWQWILLPSELLPEFGCLPVGLEFTQNSNQSQNMFCAPCP